MRHSFAPGYLFPAERVAHKKIDDPPSLKPKERAPKVDITPYLSGIAAQLARGAEERAALAARIDELARSHAEMARTNALLTERLGRLMADLEPVCRGEDLESITPASEAPLAPEPDLVVRDADEPADEPDVEGAPVVSDAQEPDPAPPQEETPPVARTRPPNMKERVLAELANGPGTARQIAARMGLPRGSVASTLSKLAHHDDARAVAAFDEDAGASVYSLSG